MSTNWYDDPSAPLSRDDVRNEIQNFLQSQSAASSYAPKGTPWQAVDLPLVTVLPSKPQGRDEVNLLNTVTNGVTRWIYLTKTAAWAQISGPPIGVIEWTCAADAPLGYLIADGTAVSRITYAGLFALCSTTYGVGDGSTTFNVPDLRGRVPIGAGTGAGLTARSLSATPGTETHSLSVSEIPSHAHSPNGQATFLTWDGGTLGVASGGGLAQATGSPSTTGNQGGNGSHNNMQPSLVLTPIIRT